MHFPAIEETPDYMRHIKPRCTDDLLNSAWARLVEASLERNMFKETLNCQTWVDCVQALAYTASTQEAPEAMKGCARRKSSKSYITNKFPCQVTLGQPLALHLLIKSRVVGLQVICRE